MFQRVLSVKSLEGTVRLSADPDLWRCYTPVLEFIIDPTAGTPVVTSCRMKVVMVSRKGKDGKTFTFPLEASSKKTVNSPLLQCDETNFASVADQIFSQLASEYAQIISHIF